MTTVDVVKIRFSWVEEDAGPPAPQLLRGALGERFRDNRLFHQHDESGVLYRYPLIQYRWDRDGAMVLGLGDGARALVDSNWPGMELRIGNRLLHVRDAVCEFHRHSITLTDRLMRYRFMAPWLPLNQDLYLRYRELAPMAQVRERDRLAVAGLLLALRGFGIEIHGRLFAAFEMHSRRQCPYKGVQLLGFRGRLIANIDLPDGIALGRAVSHGYGWIEREEETLRGEIAHDQQYDTRSAGSRNL
jgi:hypothetical protein